jgi:hypothetical protein
VYGPSKPLFIIAQFESYIGKYVQIVEISKYVQIIEISKYFQIIEISKYVQIIEISHACCVYDPRRKTHQ